MSDLGLHRHPRTTTTVSEGKMTSEEIEKAYNSPAVAKIRELLSDVYTPEEFGMYLALPRAQLGKSELELIHEGREAEAIEFAQDLWNVAAGLSH